MLVFLADNLEGGAARLAEDIIVEWMAQPSRQKAVLIHAGSVQVPDDKFLRKIAVTRRNFLLAYVYRCLLVWKQSRGSFVYNFTNFPIAGFFCRGKKQLALVHNAYLVTFPDFIYGKYPKKAYIREKVKRAVFRFLVYLSYDTTFLVQSLWMKNRLDALFAGIAKKSRLNTKIVSDCRSRHISRAEALSRADSLSSSHPVDYWFYPAAFYPHKNHGFVIEVARALRLRGSHIQIALTLNLSSLEGAAFWKSVQSQALDGIIVNLGWLSVGEVAACLQQSRGLFFPSTFESLGLPLLEAYEAGKPIIAADTAINHEVTKGGAFYFDIRKIGAADLVASAMEKPIFTPTITIQPSLSNKTLLEAYVLEQLTGIL